MTDRLDYESASRLTPTGSNGAAKDADQLDRAGDNLLRLLHKAAGVAEANSRHALDMARKLAHQLRAAEDRIAELEAEIGIYREKAARAKEWLHKVYAEIEQQLIRKPEEKLQRLSRPW
jgi:endonuclease III